MDKPVLKIQLSASSIEEGEELLKKTEVLQKKFDLTVFLKIETLIILGQSHDLV